ncbi:uncharacterized protein DMENIID0001_089550 [Sergentomyia squamirostris]
MNNSIENLENSIKFVCQDILTSFTSLIYCKVLHEGEQNGYCSTLQRVEVQYLDKKSSPVTTRYIVKVLPSGWQGDFLTKYNIFDRELYFYEKILPRMKELNIEVFKAAPKFIKALLEPTSIILENLCFSGFKVPNRKVGLNLEQTLDILSKIARFHATSIKINEIEPDLFEKLKNTAIHEYPNSFSIFYKVGIASLGEVASNWIGYEEISKKLRDLEGKIMEKTLENYKKSSDGIKVLNHNDLWTNNLMLKYLDEKFLDSVIIDYQFIYWGSPGFDLNFFLYTSVEDTLRKEFWNFLIHHYHKVLTSTLRSVQVVSQIPSVVDIHNEIIQSGHHAIIASLAKGAIVLAPPEVLDVPVLLAESPEGASYRHMLFSNPEYVEMIKPLLQEFYWMGYLD